MSMFGKKSESDATQPHYPAANPVDKLKERATIGSTIRVKGDLSGEEDLTVQGRVQGKIELRNNNVTIGEKGQVKADVYAKIISVEGDVEGNLFGEEKIIIRKSGRVKGNLVAPRVSLEEGSNFKGSIDMDSSTAGGDKSTPKITTPPKSQTAEAGKGDPHKKVPIPTDAASSGGR